MTLSPLDQMIYDVFGIMPGPFPFVVLRCPLCGKQRRQVTGGGASPDGTAVVQANCNGCGGAGKEWQGVHYFDEHGREL